MLQLPEKATRLNIQARTTTRRSAPFRTASKPSLEEVITAHKRAVRIRRNKQSRLQALYDKYPDLSKPAKALIYTKPSGEKVWGRSLQDFNLHFDLNGVSRPELREPFLAALEAAWSQKNRDRRKTGISAAQRADNLATVQVIRAFNKLLRIKPRTEREVGIYARYMLSTIQNEVGGKIGVRYMSDTAKHGGYDACRKRDDRAFWRLMDFIGTLARR